MLPGPRHIAAVLLLAVSAAQIFAQGPAHSAPASGQSQAARLSIRGTVSDSTGASVPGAPLHLESAQHQPLAETQTDAQGNFTLLNLPPGDLTVVIPAYLGLAAKILPLHLTSSIANLQIALPLDSVAQQVSVAPDQALSTDPSANQDTVTVSGETLRKLPVFDQDYIAAMTVFLDASSLTSNGATILVDGVEMKTAGVSASAIQEVRVNNDPYSAEFNRPGRGRLEIITKPGSAQFHGEANFLFRDALFNARNYFATTRPPEARRIYEGHLSGPIGHGGHTSFILSASRGERDTAVAVDAITPTGPVNENVLAPSRSSQATGRVTHDFSPSHRLSVGYNFEYNTFVNGNVGGLVLPEAGVNSDSREDDLLFNDRLIINPNLVNQLQVTLEKDEDVARSVTNSQSIQVSGFFIGGGAQADVARTENTIHVTEVLSWTHGRHYLRFGGQLPQFSRRAVDDQSNRLGTFQFASLATYATNTPYVFTAQQGTGRALYWINEAGAFVQDQIALTPRLQATLGVRYDWQTYITDNNNFGPRASLAYSPGRKGAPGKTILRVGTGVFYDRTGGDFPATFKLHNGVVLRSFQLLNPSFPTALPSGAALAALPTSLVRMAANARTPYSVQYSVGVERQLHKTVTVTAAYRGFVQAKSFRSRDANAPILPANPSLTADYPRPDPSFAQIQQVESGGRALQNALDLSFRGSAGRLFSGQAQYTLSRWSSNTGGINSFPQNQYDPNDEWSRASADRLQRLNLLGTINPDHWLSLGVATALYSGTPYTETTGNDDYHTGLGNARPAGIARNTLHAGGTATVDLTWSHDFRLSRNHDSTRALSTEVAAFNVLNHTNYLSYIGNLNSSRFMQPTTASPGRQLQFSVGYRF
jgi:Carboxypeptidase regulatory-like domain/TonB dependent receptor